MSDDFLNLKKGGYSQEEAYFHKLNRELIEKLKRKQRGHLKLVVDNTNGSQSEDEENRSDDSDSGSGSGNREAA